MITLMLHYTSFWGMALVHSLWQGAVIVVLFSVLTAVVRKYPSYLRYRIALLMMCVVIFSFISMLFGMRDPGNDAEFQAVKELIGTADQIMIIAPNPIVEFFVTMIGKLSAAMPIVFLIWLSVVILLIWRFGRALTSVRKFLSTCKPAGSEVQAVADSCSNAMGLHISVPVLLTEKSVSPMVVGFAHPVIVLPQDCLRKYTPEQQKFFIMHEIAHIQRGDFAVNIVLTICDIVFFFNPFIRRITEIMRRERELSCDEAVVSSTGRTLDYARALTDLYDDTYKHPLAMGMSGGLLAYRVYGLFQPKKTPAFTVTAFVIGFISLIIVTGLIDCSRMFSYTVNGHRISIAQFHSIERDIYDPAKRKSE